MVCRNSFLLMFAALKPGGNLLWIFPSTNAGAWLYFLEKLSQVFPGGISLLSSLVPSRSPVYALCRDFSPAAGQLWQAELLATPSPGRACLESWNLKTWEEAKGVVTALRPELESVWQRHCQCLHQIRKDASLLASAPEQAFTKLSGAQNPSTRKSSRADVDENWRR